MQLGHAPLADVLYTMHDCALGISPAASTSGVRRPRAGIAGGGRQRTRRIRKESAKQALLERHVEVLATTLNSAGSNSLAHLMSARGMRRDNVCADALKFDVLIVDEASQATEPSALIPLNLLKSDMRPSPMSFNTCYPPSHCFP